MKFRAVPPTFSLTVEPTAFALNATDAIKFPPVLYYIHGGMPSGRGPSSAGRAKETGAPRFFWMHRSCFALLRAWTSLVEWSFLWSFGTSPMISPTCPAYFCRNAYVSPWAACASHPWNWSMIFSLVISPAGYAFRQ